MSLKAALVFIDASRKPKWANPSGTITSLAVIFSAEKPTSSRRNNTETVKNKNEWEFDKSLELVNDADNIKGWVIPPIANSLSIARPDNWDTVPGATGVLDGTQNQGLDVEHSGQKEAGIEDRAARAHGKRTKRYCVDNSGGKCLRDEVKFGSKIQKTIATFDTFKTTVGGEDFKEAGRSFSILTCGS
ncbi:hypothetical protein R3P38DRAFT_2772321 [Favolaschia claudopus]|uniref:Uncharacterized protein n=1 Tax=Favolaschia claudopus TaxID=2862362 RepID=A0AAW0C5A7_9AGAR